MLSSHFEYAPITPIKAALKWICITEDFSNFVLPFLHGKAALLCITNNLPYALQT